MTSDCYVPNCKAHRREDMTIKYFEIRDKGTFMPIMAVEMFSENPDDWYLLRRAGFGEDFKCIFISVLESPTRSQWDVHEWPRFPRTIPVAHDYIQKHFHELKSGDVIDVQFILGETGKPKLSEKSNHPLYDI